MNENNSMLTPYNSGPMDTAKIIIYHFTHICM